MSRKNNKSFLKIKSEFNFRSLSKQNLSFRDKILFLLLVLIFFILVILLYLDYQIIQRLDGLFMNYQNLFDRQLQINNKLDEYIKEISNKDNFNLIETENNNSERLNKILYNIGAIIIFYFAVLGIGIINVLLENPTDIVLPNLLPEIETLILENEDNRLPLVNINNQTEILPIEQEDGDNRIRLPINDNNVIQIIPADNHVVIREEVENIILEAEVNNDIE